MSQPKNPGLFPQSGLTQRLGCTKRDAWTSMGRSGSLLFDGADKIVALHNSWDSTIAMRLVVTQQAIVKFLAANGIVATIGGE
ncbi:MAG: hypothetical protein IT427_00415 [Pirellulales bacterium]|nr:hypothetical protein [Pirellulales bacterium]